MPWNVRRLRPVAYYTLINSLTAGGGFSRTCIHTYMFLCDVNFHVWKFISLMTIGKVGFLLALWPHHVLSFPQPWNSEKLDLDTWSPNDLLLLLLAWLDLNTYLVNINFCFAAMEIALFHQTVMCRGHHVLMFAYSHLNKHFLPQSIPCLCALCLWICYLTKNKFE